MFTPTWAWAELIVCCVAAYLLGSINFAIIISKIIAKDDVRSHGSGNAGMTNMLRTYGKWPAILTALGDFLKAVAAVVIPNLVGKNLGYFGVHIGYITGIFVILGHLYPVFFGFKGGKGVMSTLGVLLAVNPVIFVIVLVSSLPLAFITKIISLASIAGALMFASITVAWAIMYWPHPLYYCICTVITSALILAGHKDNIKRLHSGTENRLGDKKRG